MASRDSKKQDDTTVAFPIGDLTVVFTKPEAGQLAALRRAATLFQSSDTATQGKGGLLFLDVLDNLVSDEAILHRVYEGLARKTIPLEDYAECVIALLKHFAPQEEEAPRNGPVSTRRPRAAANRSR